MKVNEIIIKFSISSFLLATAYCQLLSQSLLNIEWSTYHGGSANDAIRDMTVDASGNVYIIGSTASLNNISTQNAYRISNSGLNDVYIAKYSPDGLRVWSTYYGGQGDDIGQSIAIDPMGNVVVTGLTFSTNSIASPGVHLTSYQNEGDIFVAKFTDSGNFLWGTYYGGEKFDFANDITSDPLGNIIITGWTNSQNGIASTGAYKTLKSDTTDICLAKFSGNGQLLWSTYYGHNGAELGLQVESDAQSKIYISGWTSSTNQFATTGAHQDMYGGESADAFIGKFTSNGSPLWMSYYGGSGRDYADALYVNASGNVYLSGSTNSNNNISTNGVHQSNLNGDFDVFLAYFNTNGERIRCTYFGGSEFDTGYRLFQNSDGNIWVTGHTRSTDGISTVGTFQTIFGGGLDAFVAEFDMSARLLRSTYFGGTSNEESFGLIVNNNSVFISGKTTSSNRIAFGNAVQKNSGGGDDGFLTKFGCAPLNINIIANSVNICQGASLQLSTNLGSSYQWSGPNGFNSTLQNPKMIENIQTIQAGIYSVTVTDASSCTGTDTISISVRPQPLVLLNSNSPVCEGEDIMIQINGGISYVWSGPIGYTSTSQNPVINATNVNQSGFYRVTVTGSNACTKTDSIYITIRGQANVNVESNSPVCQGDTVRLSATNGNSYLWTGPSGYSSTLRNPSFVAADTSRSGNYILVVRDSLGCIATKYLTVSILPKPKAEIAGKDTICSGNQLTLISTGTGDRLWSTGSTSQQISVNPAQNTIYTLILNQDGCRDTAELKVIVLTPPEIQINFPQNEIEYGTSVQLSATGAATYLWAPSSELSCTNCPNPVANPKITTEICLTGFNQFGCRVDTCFTIFVKRLCDIVLPNIISPNNDLINDTWCSLAKDCIKEQHLEIYDRWGNKIFSSKGT